MFLLQESSKRNKIIKERREVLNERIRVAENQADVGWKMIRLDESTRGTIFENLVHNNNYKKNDRACSIFFFLFNSSENINSNLSPTSRVAKTVLTFTLKHLVHRI